MKDAIRRLEALQPNRQRIECFARLVPELVRLGMPIEQELEGNREAMRQKVEKVGSIVGEIQQDIVNNHVRLIVGEIQQDIVNIHVRLWAKVDPWKLRQQIETRRRIAAAVWKPRGPRLARLPRRDRRFKRAVRRLARALQAGLTSPARPWFRLSVPGMQSPETERWLRAVEKETMANLPTTQLALAIQQVLDPSIPSNPPGTP